MKLEYTNLESAYNFIPVAIKTAGPRCLKGKSLIWDLHWRIWYMGCDPRSGSFQLQQVSVAVLRGNIAELPRIQ